MGDLDTLLASALDLAGRGFRVFPLKPGDYRPAVEGWKELATIDAAMIRKVWSKTPYNIGVAGGQGLLIVDVDMKKGKDGLASLKALGVELSGYVVRTPTGGLHGYYNGPDVANSVGRLGSGLDVRSAGGYVVGPGSVLAEGVKDGQPGGRYELVRSEGVEPVPATVVQRLVGPVIRQGSASPVDITPDDAGAVARAAQYLGTSAPVAVEGEAGDHTTYQVAARLKDFGISAPIAVELMAEHWLPRCSFSWPIEDAAEWLKTKIANAYEYGTSPLGIAHPAADFAGVKLIEPPAPEPRPASKWFRHGDARGKIDWLYRNLLPRVGVGVLLAVMQAGKTFTLIELARSLATGKVFFKEEPKELGGTLFVFAGTEGSGLAARLDALGETDRLPISAMICGSLSDKDALANLLADLKSEAANILRDFGVPVRMIVLETLSATGLLQDENDNSEAARAMANLATMSREMGALMLTSHHPSKDGKGARGASAILNSADYVLEITRHEQAAVRELALIKARDAEQRKLGSFTLVPVNLGEDDDGEPITSMSLSMGDVRIDLSRPPPYLETFMNAVEWGVAEQGEMANGRRGVEEGAARLQFRDLKTGSKDKSNYGKAFKKCQLHAEAMGAVTAEPCDGKTYLFLREKILGDEE